MNRKLGHRYVRIETSRDLERIFDLDFTENKECFRPDTLLLGYYNEADRIIQETMTTDGYLDVHELIDIALSDSYYLEYEASVDEISDDLTIVSIAYITQ